MDGERWAAALLIGWLIGMPVTWGYWWQQCDSLLAIGTKGGQGERLECSGVASVMWPLVLPANISYRVFAE